MKTIDEIRLANLELAIERMGGVAAKLAAAADLAPAYISQIRTRSPDTKTGKPRGLGAEAARKIEAAIGEGPGWMDAVHSGQEREAAPPSAWPFSVPPKELSLLSAAELSALNAVVTNFVAGCLAKRPPATTLQLGPAASDQAQARKPRKTMRRIG
jgi:hypothetical protein